MCRAQALAGIRSSADSRVELAGSAAVGAYLGCVISGRDQAAIAAGVAAYRAGTVTR